MWSIAIIIHFYTLVFFWHTCCLCNNHANFLCDTYATPVWY